MTQDIRMLANAELLAIHTDGVTQVAWDPRTRHTLEYAPIKTYNEILRRMWSYTPEKQREHDKLSEQLSAPEYDDLQ